MNKPTITVVDPDPVKSAELADRLHRLGYRVTGRYTSGEQALDRFKQELSDLIILDTQLSGGLDGIDTATAVRRTSQVPIIFLATDTDDDTYRRARLARPSAFLSRPFKWTDLAHAIDLALSVNPVPSSGAEQEPIFPEGESAVWQHDRLFLKVRDRLVRIMLAEILWVEADDYYCKVVTDEREYLVTKTLKKLAALLPPEAAFVRCHRSYLVNLNRITEMTDTTVKVGGHEIPVSRSKRSEVMVRLGKV